MRLPFNIETQINTYQPEAFISGIVFAQGQYDMPYFLSNYIRTVHYFNAGTLLNYYMDNPLLENDGLITEDLLVIPMKYAKNVCLAEIAKKALDSGRYVFGTFNDQYIPGKQTYEKKYFIHDYLLYGYENNAFISAAYLKGGHYREFTVDFSDYSRAMLTQEPDLYMHFLQYHAASGLGFMEQRVRAALYDYLSSVQLADDGCVYGLQALNLFADEIEQNDSHIDLRSLCFLHEHKSLMKMRLVYMKSNGYINISDNMLSDYEHMLHCLQAAVMLAMKHQIAPNKRIPARIAETIRIAVAQDEAALNIVVKQL